MRPGGDILPRMTRSLARFLLLGLAASGALAIASDAEASVSTAVLFDDLVAESATVDVVTPKEAKSVWENGRIVTYTRVHVDDAVAGSAGVGSDVWVQTLGGEVGDVGQQVEGEANLAVGKPALVFLKAGPSGTFWVTARAQGQYPVRSEGTGAATKLHVIRNGAVGAILPAPAHVVAFAQKRAPSVAVAIAPAMDVLHERALDDAKSEIRSAWTRTHAH